MKNIIIRNKNIIGNSFSNIMSLLVSLFLLFVLLIALAQQLNLYTDGLAVISLLVGISSDTLNSGIQQVFIILTILIVPVLTVLAKKYK